MDEEFFFTLTNLLNLQNHLDPTTSLLSDSIYTASPTSLLTTNSAAPLLLFAVATVIPSIASRPPNDKKRKTPSSAACSVAAFRALSTEHIWAMEAPLRDAQWRSLYGLSYPVFNTVVDKLKPYITRSQISLPSDYAVAMVLSRLSNGLSAKTLASRYGLEPYLVCKITNMVTRLLATKLYPEFIQIPVSRRRVVETTQGFQELTSLPNICGAIHGTPIRLHHLPSDTINSSMYFCKHGFPAILLQVVADHKKVFWDACVKAPGGFDDATHFRDSLLYNRLISEDIVWDRTVHIRGQAVKPHLVGDWKFPLLSFLLTPFSRYRTGGPAQNTFDEALVKGRKTVEEAIGLLKARWKILQDLNVDIRHAPQTVVACCVLHNLCQIAKEPEPEAWKGPEEIGLPPKVLDNEKSSYYDGDSARQALADDLYHRLSSR